MPDCRSLATRLLATAFAIGATLLSFVALTDVATANTTRPYGRPGLWKLVFRDEFSSSTLNGKAWTRCYWWDQNGCTNLGNKELQWYMPSNVSISNGKLVLTAKKQSMIGYKGKTFPYTSGMVTTGRNYDERSGPDRFATTYGYFEIRAKLPAGKGLWPAFWLLPSTQESRPEIDIMEMLGDAPKQLEMHVHFRDANGTEIDKGEDTIVADMSAGYHVYGLEWRPDAIIWYFDGKPKWRFTDKSVIPREPLYILLNLAVGGNWPGDPDAKTKFPSSFVIDYVRVWKKIPQ